MKRRTVVTVLRTYFFFVHTDAPFVCSPSSSLPCAQLPCLCFRFLQCILVFKYNVNYSSYTIAALPSRSPHCGGTPDTMLAS